MKKLLIVCDDKLKKHGDFLAQLISARNENEENIVAQVWDENQYNSNSAQISSEQYILFIGNSKLIKSKSSRMTTKWEKFDTSYGWLGKQGYIRVDKVVSIDNYDKFLSYAQKLDKDTKNLIEKEDYVKLEIETKENVNDNKLAKFINGTAKRTENILTNVKIAGKNTFYNVLTRKKIEDQQYSLGVLEYYINGIQKFLGIEEE